MNFCSGDSGAVGDPPLADAGLANGEAVGDAGFAADGSDDGGARLAGGFGFNFRCFVRGEPPGEPPWLASTGWKIPRALAICGVVRGE